MKTIELQIGDPTLGKQETLRRANLALRAFAGAMFDSGWSMDSEDLRHVAYLIWVAYAETDRLLAEETDHG